MKVWTLESLKIFICTQSVCLSEKFLKLSTNFYVDNYVAFITTESGNLRESTDRKKRGEERRKWRLGLVDHGPEHEDSRGQVFPYRVLTVRRPLECLLTQLIASGHLFVFRILSIVDLCVRLGR